MQVCARRGEHAADDPVGGGVEVGVRKDHLRRLAAQLQAAAGEVVGGGPRDLTTDLRRTGEGNAVDPGMRAVSALPVSGPHPGDHVDHTGRKTGLMHKPGERQGVDRGVIAQLDDDRDSRPRGRVRASNSAAAAVSSTA